MHHARVASSTVAATGPRQRLTLVHFSAQRERFLWDRGCNEGFFRGCLAGILSRYGAFKMSFVSGMAQVELKCGQV